VQERRVFENALLGFLFEAPGHGYDLSLHFAEGGDLAAVGHLGKSQLYALLKALESHHLAEPTLEEGEGGPARRVYRITEAGRARFLRWVTEPTVSIRGLRVEFLLKLYFLSRLALPGLPELLDAQEGVLQRRLERLGAEETRGGLAPWVAQLQEGLIDAGLRWIAEWRERGIEPVPETRGSPRPGILCPPGKLRPNQLRAVVAGQEEVGGLLRLDLDLESGRVTLVVPREALAEGVLAEGMPVTVTVPPGALVLSKLEEA
jgi:DNA-binding PadR family transcriptional regulator